MEADIQRHTTGLRTIFMPNPGSKVVHIAVLINTGSRDESPVLNGVSHFIEHMVFKGTEKRKAFHILNRLDSVGGEINAYTTKEQTCYYASVSMEHAERAMDLLADILLHSTFPEAEIEKEKNVISEEIDMYQDYPEETIVEDFESQLFPEQALGKTILGTRDTITHFSKKDLVKHYKSWYTAPNIAIGLCGDMDSDGAHALMLQYFKTAKSTAPISKVKSKASKKLFARTTEKSLQQAHVLMGGEAPSRHAMEQWALQVLVNLLGGPAMNSRLNLSIREKYGLVYQINAFYTPYDDTGFTGIYFSSEAQKRLKVIHLIEQQLIIINQNGITSDALNKALRQLCGNIRIQQDNRQHLLHHFLKESFQKQILSPEYHIEKLLKVTPDQLHAVALKYLNPEKLSRIVYLPEASATPDL